MKHQIARTIAITALAIAIAACSTTTAAPTGGSTPPVDEARATAIAQNALEGYNSGDYAVWARDWSETMLGVIKDKDFQAVRAQLMETAGRFVSIDGVTYRESKPGVHRYTFAVTFERMPGTFWISFVGDSPKIEGVKFE